MFKSVHNGCTHNYCLVHFSSLLLRKLLAETCVLADIWINKIMCHYGHVYCYLPEQDDLVKEELSVPVVICETPTDAHNSLLVNQIRVKM